MCVHCSSIFFLKSFKLYHEEFGHKSTSNPLTVSGVANIKVCAKNAVWLNYKSPLLHHIYDFIQYHLQKPTYKIPLYTSPIHIFTRTNMIEPFSFPKYNLDSLLRHRFVFPQFISQHATKEDIKFLTFSFYKVTGPGNMIGFLKQSIVIGYVRGQRKRVLIDK